MAATGETTIETQFELPLEQRKRLLAGDYKALVLDSKPYGCNRGATYVLAWSRPQKSEVDGIAIVVPRSATCWITIADITRHRKGGWMVRFDVTDTRETVRFLRRTPPIVDPHSKPGNEESSYTTSRYGAIDELEVVPSDWQERRSRLAFEHDHAQRLVDLAERNRQMWRRKRKRATGALAAA